jgi:uncharacterized protein DUF5615
MLRFLADENFNGDIVRGVRRRSLTIDIARVQDVGLSGAGDPAVLEWAANEGRVLLTHDAATITRYADERVRAGLLMAGVFEVNRSVPIRAAIDDIILLAECSRDDEWEGRVDYLPL